ncbi:PilN domain-containing protein [Virgibacillus senegalensis]|uniref:PilN domain-containing protein n=1 Tax=Virgibacillus senegalensis TaxID=1499679 RepID=UPI0006A00034|nr:PilN domain-containing protein [Virgibacillus senegalensis]
MTVEINFIAQEKKNRLIPVTAVILLILLFISIGLLYCKRTYLENQVEDMQEQWNANNVELSDQTANQKRLRDRNELEERVKTVETALFSTTDLLEEIGDLLPESGYLSSFQFDQMEGVELVMEVDSLSEAAAFSDALTNQPYIQNVAIDTIYSNETANGKIYQSSYRLQVDGQVFKEVMGDEN